MYVAQLGREEGQGKELSKACAGWNQLPLTPQ